MCSFRSFGSFVCFLITVQTRLVYGRVDLVLPRALRVRVRRIWTPFGNSTRKFFIAFETMNFSAPCCLMRWFDPAMWAPSDIVMFSLRLTTNHRRCCQRRESPMPIHPQSQITLKGTSDDMRASYQKSESAQAVETHE